MGHRHCHLTVHDVVRFISSEPFGSDVEQETWFVKQGLEVEAMRWGVAFEDDGKLDELQHAIDNDIPETFRILFFLERPLDISGLDYPVNAFVLGRPPGDDTRIRLLDVFHVCSDGVKRFYPEQEAPASMLFALGMSSRLFAMAPLPKRPQMDVDVIGPRESSDDDDVIIDAAFVIRWRRSKEQQKRAEAQGFEVSWSHRWIVRAHLRQLASGRIVSVREHVKGPKDKPLVLKHAVNALVR